MQRPPEETSILPDGDEARPSLFVRWHPVAAARGTVVIVHGFGEHSGRYAHAIETLVGRGYACFAIDYRGWGRAGGRRGFVRRFDEYLDDVEWAVEEAAQRSGQQPFLFGHSLGGLVCARFAIARSPSLRGLVLSSPAFRFAIEVPTWKRLAARVAARIWPTFSLPAGVRVEKLTGDADVVESMEHDPLMVRRATARWYVESLRAQKDVLSGAADLATPSMFVVAGDDRIVDAETVRQVYERASSTDKTWRCYAEASHVVFSEREPIRSQAFEDLIGWLDQR